MMTAEPLLSVRGLSKHFGAVRAVESVSFDVARGEVVGLVGESGSGKTTIGRSILRLSEPTSGDVIFDGKNLPKLSPSEMRAERRRMQYIFQDPFASLSPRMTIGEILTEGLAIQHVSAPRAERRAKALDGARRRGVARRRHRPLRARVFPAVSASASASPARSRWSPTFLVADEPGLGAGCFGRRPDHQPDARSADVRLGLTMLFISHDLAVVEYICRPGHRALSRPRHGDRAERTRLYAEPKHPYTRALLSAVPDPDLDRPAPAPDPDRRHPEPGSAAVGLRLPLAMPACGLPQCALEVVPPLEEGGAGTFRAPVSDPRSPHDDDEGRLAGNWGDAAAADHRRRTAIDFGALAEEIDILIAAGVSTASIPTARPASSTIRPRRSSTASRRFYRRQVPRQPAWPFAIGACQGDPRAIASAASAAPRRSGAAALQVILPDWVAGDRAGRRPTSSPWPPTPPAPCRCCSTIRRMPSAFWRPTRSAVSPPPVPSRSSR